MPLVIVGLLAIAFAGMLRNSFGPPNSRLTGKEFPPIEVAGWINGPGPDAAQLKGRVVVIDAWAFWCGPCRMATPTLMHLHEKYKDQQVVFIGLTSEGLDQGSLDETRKYVKSENIPWANGYGAVKPLGVLEVNSIPQFWVLDGQNRIVAHIEGFSPALGDEIERAVIKALAAPTDGKSAR